MCVIFLLNITLTKFISCFMLRSQSQSVISFNNNANHVRFDIKVLILSRSNNTDGVRSKKYFLSINLSCVLTASLWQKNNFWLIAAVNAGALMVNLMMNFTFSYLLHLTSFLRPENLKRKLTVCNGKLFLKRNNPRKEKLDT